MATYPFIEESDYGQDLLVLLGEISSLMDPEKEYSKTTINSTLIRIKNRASNIQREISGRDKDLYFRWVEE